ncbi:hypothetical protein HYS94_03400 [Candidatus Daviesbacteria bacterium]|nr:hypothetical protein [Candidatus Daviesbacteria bacterium]
MGKILNLLIGVGFLSIAFTIFQIGGIIMRIDPTETVYATHSPGHITIERPRVDGRDVGFSTLGDFIQKTLVLAFMVAVLVVLAMLVWGAFEWITSGGDKEAVGKARGRIINALIGLAVLAIAFALFQVAGLFLGFDIRNFNIPTPAP